MAVGSTLRLSEMDHMRRLFSGALLWGLSFVVFPTGGLEAQDVELLGKLHGTRPPQAYYDLMARDQGAFQFQRAMLRKGLRLRQLPPVQARGRILSTVFSPSFAGALAVGEEQAPVAGPFNFPLVLGLFTDSPEPHPSYTRERVQEEYWDGPQANPDAVGTIPDFYSEMSRGLVSLSGVTFDWRRTTLTRADVTAGVSGLGEDARTGEFIVQVLERVDDGSVDWGQFDNDGPDGI